MQHGEEEEEKGCLLQKLDPVATSRYKKYVYDKLQHKNAATYYTRN